MGAPLQATFTIQPLPCAAWWYWVATIVSEPNVWRCICVVNHMGVRVSLTSFRSSLLLACWSRGWARSFLIVLPNGPVRLLGYSKNYVVQMADTPNRTKGMPAAPTKLF